MRLGNVLLIEGSQRTTAILLLSDLLQLGELAFRLWLRGILFGNDRGPDGLREEGARMWGLRRQNLLSLQRGLSWHARDGCVMQGVLGADLTRLVEDLETARPVVTTRIDLAC